MIQYLYLGRVGYDDALRLQEELVALRVAGRIENVLLLLEHPPVLTLGRNANRGNVLASDELLAERGVTLHQINRGGDVTYHGPGQLIGYPIFDLRSLRNANSGRLGPVDFVRLMEEALIRICAEYGVSAGRICGLTGVWCAPQGKTMEASCGTMLGASKDEPKGERKIAAIGIHVSRGVTSHGFAFNLTTDLSDFLLINPCGITNRPVTSLELELKRNMDERPLPALEAVAQQTARQFGSVFGEQILALENLDPLRALAEARAEETSQPTFPAQDIPLQIPREVERLYTSKDRPARA
jgi:lipoyl(octanoyl) transferase